MQTKVGQLWQSTKDSGDIVEIIERCVFERRRNRYVPECLVRDISSGISFKIFDTKLFVFYKHISGPNP